MGKVSAKNTWPGDTREIYEGLVADGIAANPDATRNELKGIRSNAYHQALKAAKGMAKVDGGAGISFDPADDDLIDPERFAKGTVSDRERARWVASNLCVTGVEPEDAPNAETWAMLVWARSDPDAFWTKVHPKPRAEVEGGTMREDDGRELLETCARLLVKHDQAIGKLQEGGNGEGVPPEIKCVGLEKGNPAGLYARVTEGTRIET